MKRNKIKRKRRIFLYLLFILILAFLIRIWNIEFWEDCCYIRDEIATLLSARDVFGGSPIPFPKIGPLGRAISLPAIIFTREIVKSLLIARMIRVLMGISTIVVIYFLTKEYYGQKTALIATFLISTFSSHVLLSRLAIQQGPALFFCTLTLYFLYKFSLNKDEKFLYAASLIAGLGILTHLAVILFLISILIPFVAFFKPKISKKSLVVSLLIVTIISYPIIENLLSRDYIADIESSEGSSLLNVRYNIFRGAFVAFPAFLKGDCSPNVSGIKNTFSLFPLLVLLFILYSIKKRDKKSLFLLFSLVTGFLLASTAYYGPTTHDSFHPITFYIIIPVISIAIARVIYSFYKKFGRVSLLIIFLLIITEIPFVFESNSNNFHDIYPYCIENVAKNINQLNYNILIHDETRPEISHTLKYRLYEIGFEKRVYENYNDIAENVLIVFSPGESNTSNDFFNNIKSLGWNISSVKNITCEEYGTDYLFYELH